MLPWPRQNEANLGCGLLPRLQKTAVYWICRSPQSAMPTRQAGSSNAFPTSKSNEAKDARTKGVQSDNPQHRALTAANLIAAGAWRSSAKRRRARLRVWRQSGQPATSSPSSRSALIAYGVQVASR